MCVSCWGFFLFFLSIFISRSTFLLFLQVFMPQVWRKQWSHVGQSEGSPDKQAQNLVMKTGKCWKPMATIAIQAGLFPPGPLREAMAQE